MNRKDEILKLFPKELRALLGQVPAEFEDIQEIRLRAGQPVIMVCRNREYMVGQAGELLEPAGDTSEMRLRASPQGQPYRATREELRAAVDYMSSYSLYAAEEELRQGFITVQGGHRIGVAGRTVADRQGVRLMKFISFVNVRVAHQVKGCADGIMEYLYSRDPGRRAPQFCNTLIISPPRCGKTTLLRDVIRQISSGNAFSPGMTVGVVDERSELGACYQGVPQNDLGPRTDVLDCCPKDQGMMMLVRSMAPQVVAVDEIGSAGDVEAISYIQSCGCALAATVHGASLEDIYSKPALGQLVAQGVFDRYILLEAAPENGRRLRVLDRDGRELGRDSGELGRGGREAERGGLEVERGSQELAWGDLEPDRSDRELARGGGELERGGQELAWGGQEPERSGRELARGGLDLNPGGSSRRPGSTGVHQGLTRPGQAQERPGERICG